MNVFDDEQTIHLFIERNLLSYTDFFFNLVSFGDRISVYFSYNFHVFFLNNLMGFSQEKKEILDDLTKLFPNAAGFKVGGLTATVLVDD